jgi:hypothetical protein
MKASYLTILSLLTSCFNSVDAKLEQRYVAPELLDGTVVAMADQFFDKCGGREKVPFIVLVSRMPEGVATDSAIGHCTKIPGGAVYLMRDWWLNASDKRRTFLLFHELGHCALGLLHNQNNWLMSKELIPEDIIAEKTIEEAFEAVGCK